jgi:hypothetical protein
VGFYLRCASSGNKPSLKQDAEIGTGFLTSILSKKKNCDVCERPGSPGAKQVNCVSEKKELYLGRVR